MRRKAAAAAPGRKAGALGRALPPNCQRARPQSPQQPASSAGRTRTKASAARYSGRAGRAARAAGPSARGSEKGRGRSRERGPEPGAGPWRRAREGVGERLCAQGSFSRGTSDLSPTGKASVLARAPLPQPPGAARCRRPPGSQWALVPAGRGRGRPGGQPRPGSLSP